MDCIEFQVRDILQPASEPVVSQAKASGSVSAQRIHRTGPVVMVGLAVLGLHGSKSRCGQAGVLCLYPPHLGLRASAGNEGVGDPRQM